MPTREGLGSFWRDWDRLSPLQQRAFREAAVRFIADIADGGLSFHLRLRVQGHPGVWEMTWTPDGRATFEHGAESARASLTPYGGALARTWCPPALIGIGDSPDGSRRLIATAETSVRFDST